MSSIKDWFLTRRIQVEKQCVLQRLFRRKHVYPPSHNASPLQHQLLHGKFEEDQIPALMDAFKTAVDINHPCREPGLAYLRHLRRGTHTEEMWDHFAKCRKRCQRHHTEKIEREQAKLGLIDEEAYKMWQIHYRANKARN